ncbi:hypothetical protein PoB_005585000 [Plakobranchus ocellatus]|uniref:Uncharacterized protein n=1 Tax=Plakobranchus ocellatus TaxID=259542 RepID=A0AAV4CCF9_9GAST|nr:hypothetical protein PoB_005585000 [Plakobranchus ocellatus]
MVAVEEKKHFTPNTLFCCANNQPSATHSRRIPPPDASTANDPKRFDQYYKIKHQTFDDLPHLCASDLRENTNFCRAISTEKRLVLMVIVDATGKFLVTDVEDCGSFNDGGTFQDSSVFK